ncbi:HD domain-containing protein [Clostridium lundense]|uniref:HD domain-containing protein n=1 Tax=Clostridium lundense TaxID=319475 RepID=UPI0004855C1F|nr:HD domain-containing protein [Clostridium lundense]
MGNNLHKVNKILNSEKYKEYIKKNNECEMDREFCKHDINHFLDVARIAYIISLEKGLNYSKEVIYAIAILHDIGRWMQYEKGIPHEEASYILAQDLLKEVGFSEGEENLILQAILSHRKDGEDELNSIIYKSDKLSRKCFACNAEVKCNWSEDKKNFNIVY